jgi:putative pyoverdin transport system ATP-binding/permease protein
MKGKANMIKKIFVSVLVVFVLLSNCNIFAATSDKSGKSDEDSKLSSSQISSVEKLINEQMKLGRVPGASIVIVKGDKTVYEQGFGYADLQTKRKVTPQTLFEIGSNTKAFTALEVLKLQQKGLLDLDDPASKYIPGFKMTYGGIPQEITIAQLMHHSSGIPYKSLGNIPIDESDNALENTVRMLAGTELANMPGVTYGYASINYDILGLIIQKISHQSFEKTMETDILKPLGLNNTYLFRKDAALHDMATGYKMGYFSSRKYNAPMYRGNTPAAYIISNGEDMAKWLKIQLQTDSISEEINTLITESHIPDRKVQPNGDGSLYSAGWSAAEFEGQEYFQSGNNPNFSSSIAFSLEHKLGVAVLTNINTTYSNELAVGILDTIVTGASDSVSSDIFKNVDTAACLIIIISFSFILICLYFIGRLLYQIIKKKRSFTGINIYKALGFVVVLLFIAIFTYILYLIPNVLFKSLSWAFVFVWAPSSLTVAGILLYTAVVIFCLYYLLESLFSKEGDKPFFAITILGITSGVGNAMIIFAVNQAFSATGELKFNLFLYFIMGIGIFVLGQRVVRSKMIIITNGIVFEKRMGLINLVLNSQYQKFEAVEKEKIYASINNDTDVISNFANTLISGITALITLVACFVYLGILSFLGLVVSLVIISIAAGMYYIVGTMSRKLWEETRDIQNKFFKFIYDMIEGFKELTLNFKKRSEFKEDIRKSCDTYRRQRIKADINFTNVFVAGDLLFSVVIGAVAFVFPILFTDIESSSLRSYIFVFLYMTGPVRGMLNSIPSIIQFRVSWKRINDLTKRLSTLEDSSHGEEIESKNDKSLNIQLRGAKYEYKNENGGVFALGPVDFEMKSGEIVFITGGNGSGKTTLAKLITGLYSLDEGEILVNGSKMSINGLGEYFTAIFSDYHLLDKMYGIDYKNNQDAIKEYLKLLRISDKLEVNEGVFSTIRLSTGQRKRLAFLVSYLEDKQVFLFDEFAADQDAEFREFFYNTLLVELKNRGKCILAITHDDRYFNLADKVIKMDMGRIV